MPETNLVDVVNRAFAAADREDAAARRGLFAADHFDHRHSHKPRPLPGDDAQPALDRYEQAFADDPLGWSAPRTTIVEQVARGDRVATVRAMGTTHRATAKRVTTCGIVIDGVADGRIAESWSSMDRLGLYQQPGVGPSWDELPHRAGLR